jgi:hypothetical protein
MDFRTRINAVLHHATPDQVPFVPYDNLIPRGDFERSLRNLGMGLCLRRPTFWEETPNVSVETKNEGDITARIYHTPNGATRYLYGGVSGLPRWSQDQHDQPAQFEELVQAVPRREEKRLQLILNSTAEFINLGDLDGTWGQDKIRKHDLPLHQKWVPVLKSREKKCALHAHAINISHFKEVVSEIGCDVVKACTPPPVGNLSLLEARRAWGKDVVIWINFPETVFWSGKEANKQYTLDLIISDPPANALVIGFTGLGPWGAMTDELERVFREGTLAIMYAIDECRPGSN